MLPLLPGFAGEITSDESVIMKIQMHYQYKTICRGNTSLLCQLEDMGIADPSQYIQFYGLRTHSRKN